MKLTLLPGLFLFLLLATAQVFNNKAAKTRLIVNKQLNNVVFFSAPLF